MALPWLRRDKEPSLEVVEVVENDKAAQIVDFPVDEDRGKNKKEGTKGEQGEQGEQRIPAWRSLGERLRNAIGQGADTVKDLLRGTQEAHQLTGVEKQRAEVKGVGERIDEVAGKAKVVVETRRKRDYSEMRREELQQRRGEVASQLKDLQQRHKAGEMGLVTSQIQPLENELKRVEAALAKTYEITKLSLGEDETNKDALTTYLESQGITDGNKVDYLWGRLQYVRLRTAKAIKAQERGNLSAMERELAYRDKTLYVDVDNGIILQDLQRVRKQKGINLVLSDVQALRDFVEQRVMPVSQEVIKRQRVEEAVSAAQLKREQMISWVKEQAAQGREGLSAIVERMKEDPDVREALALSAVQVALFAMFPEIATLGVAATVGGGVARRSILDARSRARAREQGVSVEKLQAEVTRRLGDANNFLEALLKSTTAVEAIVDDFVMDEQGRKAQVAEILDGLPTRNMKAYIKDHILTETDTGIVIQKLQELQELMHNLRVLQTIEDVPEATRTRLADRAREKLDRLPNIVKPDLVTPESLQLVREGLNEALQDPVLLQKIRGFIQVDSEARQVFESEMLAMVGDIDKVATYLNELANELLKKMDRGKILGLLVRTLISLGLGGLVAKVREELSGGVEAPATGPAKSVAEKADRLRDVDLPPDEITERVAQADPDIIAPRQVTPDGRVDVSEVVEAGKLNDPDGVLGDHSYHPWRMEKLGVSGKEISLNEISTVANMGRAAGETLKPDEVLQLHDEFTSFEDLEALRVMYLPSFPKPTTPQEWANLRRTLDRGAFLPQTEHRAIFVGDAQVPETGELEYPDGMHEGSDPIVDHDTVAKAIGAETIGSEVINLPENTREVFWTDGKGWRGIDNTSPIAIMRNQGGIEGVNLNDVQITSATNIAGELGRTLTVDEMIVLQEGFSEDSPFAKIGELGYWMKYIHDNNSNIPPNPSDPGMREALNVLFNERYGSTYDEMVEQAIATISE